jgi:aminoglycoside phosphotransferase (APT) family kinase protein
MPVFFDLSSVEKLAGMIDSVCAVFDGKAEDQNVALLKHWVSHSAHRCYDHQPIGNMHGDLTPENILLDNGQPRYVLDWQRPMIAPLALESAMALRLAGYDAVKRYGDFGVFAVVFHFLWYAYICRKLLPFVYDYAHKFLLEFVSVSKFC